MIKKVISEIAHVVGNSFGRQIKAEFSYADFTNRQQEMIAAYLAASRFDLAIDKQVVINKIITSITLAQTYLKQFNEKIEVLTGVYENGLLTQLKINVATNQLTNILHSLDALIWFPEKYYVSDISIFTEGGSMTKGGRVTYPHGFDLFVHEPSIMIGHVYPQ